MVESDPRRGAGAGERGAGEGEQGAGAGDRGPGYRIERMSTARRALAIGQSHAVRRHLMYALVEADLTEPRRLLREHRERTGERLSQTAYLVACVARALGEAPRLNAFRRGRSLVFLDEVIVEVLLERTIESQPAVGYLPIRRADTKSLREIHDEIRAGQAARHETIAGERWLERIPVALTPVLMWGMRRSIRWGLRLGVAGVNNLGLGGSVAGWGLAPGAGTLAVTLGGITHRPLWVEGRLADREIANITLTFDHDVIDGAPAARFASRLVELLADGGLVREATEPDAGRAES